MMGWIEEFTKWPHRETGTKEGRDSAEYVAEVFRTLGLNEVEIESVPSVCRSTEKCELIIGEKKIDTFLANGTNRKALTGKFSSDIENAEIVYLGQGLEEDFENIDVEGKIVLCDVFFKPHKRKDFMKHFSGAKVYDPGNKLDKESNIYNIYSPNNWPFNYLFAIKKGAAGFIGILHNFMDCNYYHEDYTDIVAVDGYMDIPALWVSKQDGSELKKALSKEGMMNGIMRVHTEYEEKQALNVKGVVKGSSDDLIVIHSHHDATCRGAVQDASGMSVVFALAKYFSSLPKEEIKSTLMFLATDSHYTDYEGHVGFLDKRDEKGENIVLDFAIEHIGKEMELDDDNNIILYDEPEARMMYVADINNLPKLVYDTVANNGLEKTMILPVDHRSGGEYTSDDVCSDAYDFNARGIPVVSMISAPMYLFHNTDDIDKVHQDSLESVANTFLELVYKAWEAFGY